MNKKVKYFIVLCIVFSFLVGGSKAFAQTVEPASRYQTQNLTDTEQSKLNEASNLKNTIDKGQLTEKNTLISQQPSDQSSFSVKRINVSEEQSTSINKTVVETPLNKNRMLVAPSYNWGYQDLEKRSNGVARQALYSEMENQINAFKNETTDVHKSSENLNLIASIDLNAFGLSEVEGVETYKVFTYDHPEIYFLSNQINIGENQEKRYLYIIIDTAYIQADVRQKCDELIKNTLTSYQALASKMPTNYDKVLAVHDKLISDTEYAYDASGQPETALWAHNIIGVFDKKNAVCEGYAKAFQIILNSLNIENIYVTGFAGESHAWNMVKLDDGKYYYIDTTFDDQPSFPGGISYEYFNQPASQFEVDHKSETSTGTNVNFLYDLPKASESDVYTYYYQMNAFAKQGTTDNLEAILDHYVKAAKVVSDVEKEVIILKTDNSNFQETFNMLGMYYDMDVEKNALDFYLQEIKNAEGKCIGGGDVSVLADAEHNTIYIALNEQPDVVEVLKNNVVVGKFKSFTEAYGAMDDIQASYVLKVLTKYAMFPEKAPQYGNVRIEGTLFDAGFAIGGEEVYYTSILFMTNDITYDRDIAFKDLVIEPAFVQYNKKKMTLNGCTLKIKGVPTWGRYGTSFSWISFDENKPSLIMVEGDKQDQSQDQPQQEKNSGGAFSYGHLNINTIKLMEVTQLQFSNIIGKIGQIETGAKKDFPEENIWRHTGATVMYSGVNDIQVGTMYIAKEAYLTTMADLVANNPTMEEITGNKNNHINPNLVFGNWYNKTNQFNQIYYTCAPGENIENLFFIKLSGDIIEGDFHVFWNESSEEPWQNSDFIFLKAPALKEENIIFHRNWSHYLSCKKNEKGEFFLSKQIYCENIKAKDNLIILEPGESKKLEYNYYPENNTEKYPIQSSVFNPQIAEINNDGTITGKEKGTTSITSVFGEYRLVEGMVKVINGGEIEKLELLSEPQKKTYYVGDCFQAEGGKLIAWYKDGNSEEIPMMADMCGGYDKNKNGKQKITVTYKNQKVAFGIEVKPAFESIERIELKEPNTLSSKYYYQESSAKDNIILDNEKLLVTDKNGQKSEIDFTDKGVDVSKAYQLENGACLSITITATYKGAKTTFEIPTVSIPMDHVTSCDITSPQKTIYAVGEDLITKDGGLNLFYKDGHTEKISFTNPEVQILGYEKYTTGIQTVNVNYRGIESSFQVTVYPKIMAQMGDIDANGSINASDALQALRHSVKEIALDSNQFIRADVIKDKIVNASDALQILRYSVKEIVNFD